MPRTPRMKLARTVFKSKKVTRADAKKLTPLTRYWSNRMNRDNWYILALGAVLGFLLRSIV